MAQQAASQPTSPAPEHPAWVRNAIHAGEAARALNREAMAAMASTGEFDRIIALVRAPIEIRMLVKIFDAIVAEFPHAVLEQRGTCFVVFEEDHRRFLPPDYGEATS